MKQQLPYSYTTKYQTNMVLELHVWGPAFGLPSIDPVCIASVAYLNRIVPRDQWILVADHDTSLSPRGTYAHTVCLSGL